MGTFNPTESWNQQVIIMGFKYNEYQTLSIEVQ